MSASYHIFWPSGNLAACFIVLKNSIVGSACDIFLILHVYLLKEQTC